VRRRGLRSERKTERKKRYALWRGLRKPGCGHACMTQPWERVSPTGWSPYWRQLARHYAAPGTLCTGTSRANKQHREGEHQGAAHLHALGWHGGRSAVQRGQGMWIMLGSCNIASVLHASGADSLWVETPSGLRRIPTRLNTSAPMGMCPLGMAAGQRHGAACGASKPNIGNRPTRASQCASFTYSLSVQCQGFGA
jgi:hypothetical protein